MKITTQSTDFSALLQRFFAERLIQQRNVSPRTVESYRDSFRLLLNYAHERLHKSPTTVALEDLNPALITGFLDHLEAVRGNCIRSRNVSLRSMPFSTTSAFKVLRLCAWPNRSSPFPRSASRNLCLGSCRARR